ncbi:MAG: nickel pincer cofactor biosynthesis protein LarC [Bacillota bacterium]|nr:nickel pincer cofactor biosynthesis protein LarC [Bacillota bacterium]
MKTLYLDLGMGASGDMLMGSLYELIEDKAGFLEKINNLADLGVVVEATDSVKAGIAGTKINVKIHGQEEESIDVDLGFVSKDHGHCHNHDHDHEHCHDHDHDHHHCHNHDHNHDHDHHHDHGHCHKHHDHNHGHDHDHHDHKHNHEHHDHHHSSLGSVSQIIRSFDLADPIKEAAIGVYEILAQAEAKAHNMAVDQVHFHEVGSLDAIYDITGVAILMDMIQPDQVLASPIHLGSGHVKCAHGLMPVPAPATANILKGLPVYQGTIKGELCTPTGAGLIKYYVDDFGPMPTMTIENIGYGMGTKDFEAANTVRSLLGQGLDQGQGQDLVELQCSLDDITGEEVGFLYEVLLDQGALEVYSSPITMKKSRPGILLTVLTRPENKDQVLRLIFKHSPTLGVKEFALKRHSLDRREVLVQTDLGPVRKKVSQGFGVEKFKYEYEDLKDLAKKHQTSLKEIREKVRQEDK